MIINENSVYVCLVIALSCAIFCGGAAVFIYSSIKNVEDALYKLDVKLTCIETTTHCQETKLNNIHHILINMKNKSEINTATGNKPLSHSTVNKNW